MAKGGKERQWDVWSATDTRHKAQRWSAHGARLHAHIMPSLNYAPIYKYRRKKETVARGRAVSNKGGPGGKKSAAP